jgi:putative endonuclease
MRAPWPLSVKQMPKTNAREKIRRQRALQWGHHAEWMAMVWLMFQGYKPLARRYQGMGGEIDLIMQRGQTILFVEVKARATRDAGLLAIDLVKTQKFNKAVTHWLMRHSWAAPCLLRADAIIICPWCWPLHVKDAFTLTQ